MNYEPIIAQIIIAYIDGPLKHIDKSKWFMCPFRRRVIASSIYLNQVRLLSNVLLQPIVKTQVSLSRLMFTQ